MAGYHLEAHRNPGVSGFNQPFQIERSSDMRTRFRSLRVYCVLRRSYHFYSLGIVAVCILGGETTRRGLLTREL
jgi:hypothetical protein